MNRHLVSSITSILVSLISLSNGLAQETSVAVTLKDSLDQPQESEPVVHYFGGQTITLPIAVRTSSREQIHLQASLTQVTFSLTAQHNVVPEISPSLDQEDRPRADREVKLELPTVQRETDFQLSFQAQTESQDLWSEAGIVQIRVYPKDLLAPLKNWSRKDSNLKAKLTQVTFSLTAQHNIVPEISLPLEQENRARADREVKLELPTVQRETDFQLSFQAQTESQDLWSEAGIVQIRVYPKDLLAPLKNWSRKVQLRLDDREGILEYLLATQEVAFVDSRAQMKKLEGVPVVTMIVKNTQKVLLPRRPLAPHNSIIVFNEQVENVPKVVVTPFGTGRLIQVDLQIIKRLSEDPRAQKQFLEIIQLAHPVP